MADVLQKALDKVKTNPNDDTKLNQYTSEQISNYTK